MIHALFIQGGHPRVGAIDVIPFVPLQNIDMKACAELAQKFGRRFHDETGGRSISMRRPCSDRDDYVWKLSARANMKP